MTKYKSMLLCLLVVFAVFWGIGDVLITYIGSHGYLYNEANPIALISYSVAGWYALVGIKAVVCLALCAACLAAYEHSARLGMAMSAAGAIFGVTLFAYNTMVALGW